MLLAFGGLFVSVQPAQAGSFGVGYDIGSGFLGAYNTGVDGRQAYCVDLGTNLPFSPTSGTQTVTSLGAVSHQQLAGVDPVGFASWVGESSVGFDWIVFGRVDSEQLAVWA